MPATCCNADYDAIFDDRLARRELAAYVRSGAGGSTRRLIDAIRAESVDGASVLDIGGGVGVIGLELLGSGARSLTAVEASRGYATVAAAEIERRGLSERASVHHGDFVGIAEHIERAEVVTLDRVVCCYADWRALIDASASHAGRLYGLVYPNERWWLRVGIGVGNLMLRLLGRSFRGHIHPERKIDERIRTAGFALRVHHRGWVWQTALYERAFEA